MTVAVVLAAYAALAIVALPVALRRLTWADRSPRLALGLWLASSTSAVGALLLAAPAAAVPSSVVAHGLVELFHACAEMLSHGFGPAPFRPAGLLAAGLLLAARVVYCMGAVLVAARRRRREHGAMLDLLGTYDHSLGAVVLDHQAPVVYCLPGRRGRAVITTGALDALDAEQVAAVLAHERAHLSGRHHLLVAFAEGFVRAFPRLPLFAETRAQVLRLVELLADDVASRGHHRAHIAGALVRLAGVRVPSHTLGAGGETALTRVRRLIDPDLPLRRRERLFLSSAIVALLTGPAVAALFAGVVVALAHHCHHPLH